MNYIFPELACYKPDWVPLLKAARQRVEDHKSGFVCSALDYAARECGDGEHAKEVKDLITEAIEGHISVVGWLLANHPDDYECDLQPYRLAWIDHIIAECNKCPNP
jgi:hypothetical protein